MKVQAIETSHAPEIENALADLEMMKSLLDPNNGTNATPAAIKTEMKLVAFLGAAAAVFVGWEMFADRLITRSLLDTANAPLLQSVAIGCMATSLVLVSGGAYYLAWARARALEGSLKRIIDRELPYLAVRGLLNDLLLKFALLAMTIFSNNPRLVGPLLLAFTGDYVLQAKFFDLDKSVRWIVAAVLYGYALQAAIAGRPAILSAFAAFVGVSILSLVRSTRRLGGK